MNKQWLKTMEKALKHKMPDKVDIDHNRYDYRIDHMGVERVRTGFEQISVCVDELYGSGFNTFEDALKCVDKYRIEIYNSLPYVLYAVMQDGTLGYMEKASRRSGLKLRFDRFFTDGKVIRKNGTDPFKPKKASLCLLITDRSDFILPCDMPKLKRVYGKIILLDFSCCEVVTMIK